MSLLFFFFKQKTAYEMRISDWSSDVCSSDLGQTEGDGVGDRRYLRKGRRRVRRRQARREDLPRHLEDGARRPAPRLPRHQRPARRLGRHVAGRRSRRQGERQRSEEHTSELKSLMSISYAVFRLKKKTNDKRTQ